MNDPVPWLTADQQTVWRNYLLGVALLSQKMDADLRAFGLDLAEYEILVTLSEAPGRRIRMSDLASAVHHSRSRLTHTVTRLERDQLVVREPSHEDRRGIVAVLTDKGYDKLVETAPCHVRSVRSGFVDVVDPDDYAALGRAMIAILNAAGRPVWEPPADH